MPNQLMSIKTDPQLKAAIEQVANNPTLKGSVNARNLLELAFNEKVAEVYDFPVIGASSSRIMNEPTDELATNNQTPTTNNHILTTIN
ncbi:MAG: hypothetical protein COA97_02435 [Flavobacteriales bacterium]|nr:MAG: hypothetical protein COA97_02435 [Flavobacteriales bacterium]